MSINAPSVVCFAKIEPILSIKSPSVVHFAFPARRSPSIELQMASSGPCTVRELRGADAKRTTLGASIDKKSRFFPETTTLGEFIDNPTVNHTLRI